MVKLIVEGLLSTRPTLSSSYSFGSNTIKLSLKKANNGDDARQCRINECPQGRKQKSSVLCRQIQLTVESKVEWCRVIQYKEENKSPNTRPW